MKTTPSIWKSVKCMYMKYLMKDQLTLVIEIFITTIFRDFPSLTLVASVNLANELKGPVFHPCNCLRFGP